MREKVSIVSNSQGTSRGVKLGESYPAVFAARSPELNVQFLAMSGWTIRNLREHLENVLLFGPRIAALQFGIVECTRRILSEREKALLGLVPGGRRITYALHYRRAAVVRARRRLHLDAQVLSPEEFREDLQAVLSTLASGDIEPLLLEIPPLPARHEEHRLPFVNEDIATYNDVLREFGSEPLLTEHDIVGPIWQEGTVHLNAEGHRIAADRLAQLLAPRLHRVANADPITTVPHR